MKDEQEIRKKLGIPSDAKSVVILGQFSHLDWDWNVTFDQYYNGGANKAPVIPPAIDCPGRAASRRAE